MSHKKIKPDRVRYIKLGGKGSWENECREEGITRLGFNTAERFQTVITGRWSKLKTMNLKDGKGAGIATGIVNQCKAFFEDDGSTLWITFMAIRERSWPPGLGT